MLECSILFHSIIIGVTLGVTSDTAEFQTLLIAICFHQVRCRGDVVRVPE